MSESLSSYLFFDTETTGVPRVYNAPAHHLDNWPRMVQLAWLVTDGDGHPLRTGNFIVKPDGFRIPWRAAWVHGIMTRTARKRGVPLETVLDAFSADVDAVDVLIAHNMAFDEKIVGAEYLRCGQDNKLLVKPKRCTMQWSKHHVGLSGPTGFKWPTLKELHKKLFRKGFRGAHDALADVRACARCYFELRRIGIMP